MAEILPIDTEGALERAAAELLASRLVAFPTDTVYGLGALPEPAAVAEIYTAKGRPASKPLPLLLDEPGRLREFGLDPPPLALALAERFWPGALTLVVPARQETGRALGSSDGSIGMRVPDYAPLRALLGLCGGALAVTSANLSGRPESLTAEQVEGQLGNFLAIILDGGPSVTATPSTVVDLRELPPRILRAGELRDEVERFLAEHRAPSLTGGPGLEPPAKERG